MAPKYPSIPEPTLSPESMRDAILTLKQAFEILSGQRGNQDYRAVLLPELTAGIAGASVRTPALEARIAALEARLDALEAGP